jgi:hypothetical protein
MNILRTIAATLYYVVAGTTDCRLRSPLVKKPPSMGENEFREDRPLLVLIGPHPPHDSHGKLLLVSLARLPLGLSPERFRPMRFLRGLRGVSSSSSNSATTLQAGTAW